MIQKPISNKHAHVSDDGNGQVCKLHFTYSPQLVQHMMRLSGRSYDPEKKCWTCAISSQNLESLILQGFELDEELQKLVDRSRVKERDIKITKIAGLQGTLRPYQNIGVGFIEAKDGRALIADEMGLGKTIQAIGWLQLHPEHRPAVIVVPASLKLNWVEECEKWMKKPHVQELYGFKTYKLEKRTEIIIINYDIVSHWIQELREMKPQVLVMDEIQLIKSSTSKRTKAVKALAKGIPHIIGLSGTPIINRPVEAYNAITIIDPLLLGSYWHFTHRYCAAKKGFYGLDVTGASNTLELHEKLVGSVMLRRLKKDVLTELPDKSTSLVPIELDNMEEYRAVENDFITYLRMIKNDPTIKKTGAEALMKINVLKQLCVQGKMKAMIEWIENFLESGEKLVCFATHTATIDAVMNHFGKVAVRYDGSVSQTNRQKAKNDFQNDEKIRLFVGMIDTEGKPAGVGLTLTTARCTFTMEYQWSPTVHDQADDRVHRIGQNRAVINYKAIAAGTIEEKIARLIDAKRIINDAIIDGVETEQKHLLTELIKSYL